MKGLKYKLAHKRDDKEKWSVTDKSQRKRLIQILEEMVAQLKQDTNIPKQENPSSLLISR
jgi:hypothetical protein